MTEHEQIKPVAVHVASAAPGAMQGPVNYGYRAHYETFQLTAKDPVVCILPEDPDRVVAYVITIDNDIMIGTRNQVSQPQNSAASVPYPIGMYLPSKTTGGSIIPFPVKDCNAVYAGVTVTGNSRVSVAAYYRK